MKLFASIFFALNIYSGVAFAEPFRTNNSDASELLSKPTAAGSKFVAFEGVVVVAHQAPEKETPYFQLQLSGSPNHSIWAASLFMFGEGVGVSKEHQLRVLGYLQPIHPEDPINSINKTGIHLLTACIVNLSTQEVYFMPQAQNDCNGWQNGSIENLY